MSKRGFQLFVNAIIMLIFSIFSRNAYKEIKASNSKSKINKIKEGGDKMCEMTLIQIGGNKENKIKGCYELMTNGTMQCLKDDKYKVPKYCLKELNNKGIKFKELNL